MKVARETVCTGCVHTSVCKNKEIVLEIMDNCNNLLSRNCNGLWFDVKCENRIEREKRGEWKYWPGWCSNHDLRLEDATCPFCGYRHPVIRHDKQAPKKLPTQCPKCNAFLDIHVKDR